jgi:hypothetical protein
MAKYPKDDSGAKNGIERGELCTGNLKIKTVENYDNLSKAATMSSGSLVAPL